MRRLACRRRIFVCCAKLACLAIAVAWTPCLLAGAPFVPNDPYYGRDAPSAGWNGQWTLKYEVTVGLDARVEAAWAAGWTGAGVVIGIVDDGIQIDHPDLAPNYSSINSYDFSSNDTNPSPVQTNDNHGTPVAGIVAARGGNGIGVTGVAPYAMLAGLRVDYDTASSNHYASATLHRSSGLTRTIAIKNHSYGRSVPYIRDFGVDSECAALVTSSTAGTIHVFSAGNDRGWESAGDDPDANKKANQATPDVITVAALGSDGTWSDYSNYGANVFVTAPSSSSKGFIGGITTDRTLSNGYNDGFAFPDSSYTDFAGTSAAAPVVTGVLALAKEAQPALDGRFAKHLLARTSDVVDQFDSTITGGGNGLTAGSAWKTNAAGYRFNMNYGYGLIDAGDLVTQAVRYSGVTPRRTHATGNVAAFATVSDAAAVTQAVAVAVADPLPLEEVVISLKGSHTAMGDLSATLTSPSGSVSRLMTANSYDKSDGLDWTFTTNAFWGESPNGTWRLTLSDVSATDNGFLETWSMSLRMGDLIPVAGLTTPTLQWSTGAGTWFGSGGTNWSGGGWSSASQGVFTGTAGSISVTASGVTASQGLRFETPGYTVGGGSITLGGVNAEANTITTVAGTTTITSVITGKNAMRKAGGGTLVLTGSNSVSGAVTVAAGQLRLAGSGVAGNI
ncbi:MAG: S8 family serine peptidase, partial [Planctomycetota bacterium]